MSKPRRKPRGKVPSGWISELTSEPSPEPHERPGFEEHDAIRNEPLQRPPPAENGARDGDG